MAANLRDEIIRELPSLPETALREISRLIELFKKGKRQAPRLSPFSDLFGGISEDDAREMLMAIEECEKVDANGW